MVTPSVQAAQRMGDWLDLAVKSFFFLVNWNMEMSTVSIVCLMDIRLSTGKERICTGQRHCYTPVKLNRIQEEENEDYHV